MTIWRTAGAALAALLLAACANNGSSPAPMQFHQRLFVGDFAAGGATSSVAVYVYPLSSTSAPNSTVPSSHGPNGTRGMAFDFADDLFIANSGNNTVNAYVPLIGNTSTPALTLVNGVQQPQDLTFDNAGNLYVANLAGGGCGHGYVGLYVPSFSNTSTPLLSFCNGMNGPTGISPDGLGDIWVANSIGGTVTAYTLPASAASTPSVTLVNGLTKPVGVAFDASGSLYVADNAKNEIAVFTGTISSTSSPAFVMSNGINAPTYVILDPNGLLYVSNAANIAIYQPPFSATSAPVFTITTGVSTPVGLAVGL
jgi:hypothetical protein